MLEDAYSKQEEEKREGVEQKEKSRRVTEAKT
jgi:hypothetical protein